MYYKWCYYVHVHEHICMFYMKAPDEGDKVCVSNLGYNDTIVIEVQCIVVYRRW